MNNFYHYHRTPTRRLKVHASQLANVSTGATCANENNQWSFVSIRADIVDSKTDESFSFQMDRETAERIATQLRAYLDGKVRS